MSKKDEKKAGKSSSGHKMIVCKNCGSSVPADRDVCPYCDAPIKKGASSKKGLIIGSIAGGAAVIIGIAAVVASSSGKHRDTDPALLGSKEDYSSILFGEELSSEFETEELESTSATESLINPFLVNVREIASGESTEEETENISDSRTITVDGNQYQIIDGEAHLAHWGVTAETVARIPAAVNDYPVVSILSNAFADCPDMRYVAIGDNVITIEQYAFYKCSKLREVYFPKTVTSIKTYAFSSLQRCVTPKDSYAWQYMSLFAKEVVEGSCLTIDKTDESTKATLPATTTTAEENPKKDNQKGEKETEAEEKTAPDASEATRPTSRDPQQSSHTPTSPTTIARTTGKKDDDSNSTESSATRTTAYVPPTTTAYVPVTRPNVSPTYSPVLPSSYTPTPTTAYVPPTYAPTTAAPTTAPTTEPTTEATTEATTAESTTETTTEPSTTAEESTTIQETSEETTPVPTTEETPETTPSEESTSESTVEPTTESTEATTESIPDTTPSEDPSSETQEPTSESESYDQPTEPSSDFSEPSSDQSEPSSGQESQPSSESQESQEPSSAEDSSAVEPTEPTEDTSPIDPTEDTSPVEPTEPEFVRDLDHVWSVIAQYAQRDPSAISAGSVWIDTATGREDFVGLSPNDDGSKTLWFVGENNIPTVIATLPGSATLPTDPFWYGETLTLVSKVYDDAGNVSGVYFFAYQNGSLVNVLTLSGDLVDNGDSTFWLYYNGQKTAHLFIENGHFVELGYTQLSRNQAICYTGAREAIAYTQSATGSDVCYWLCADGALAISTTSQTYRFTASNGSYDPSAGAQVEILNVACQPSYSGLETTYPSVVEDYATIGVRQMYDIPADTTVSYNLDDNGMPEQLQAAANGILYINGSAAKTFDGCSSYVCKALRMAEADPKTYLLSIASYADGTTSLVIDWFDGASLVTATSSLNVLGSDLTNARIINMPSLSDSGKISLTIDTPIVLPLFGQYSINATFSFADGYLVPDDALSSPLVSAESSFIFAKDTTVYSDAAGGNPTTLPAGSQVSGIRLVRGESTVFLETADHQYIDLMPADSDSIFKPISEG